MQVTTTLLLLALLSPIATTGASYPANPQADHSAIFLSHQGVTAYDRQNLKVRWSCLSELQTDEPTLASGKLLVGSSSGVIALDTESGKTLWRYSVGGRLFSPSIEGGSAFVAGIDGRLHKLNLDSGQLIWQRKISDGWIYPPAIVDGLLITGGQDGKIQAVDESTGALRWHFDVGQELVFRPVATGGGSVIITTFEGKVFAIDGPSGQLQWQQQHPVASFSPAVRDGHIYLPGYDNRLRVLASDSGQLLWSRALSGRPAAAPQVHPKNSLIVTQEGDYLLLDNASGNTLHQGHIAGNSLGAVLLNDQTPLFFSQGGNIPATQPVLLGKRNL